MTGERKATMEWPLQELLKRLNEVQAEEWVCHIHARVDDREESYLESNLSALFMQGKDMWKVSCVRERYDSDQPLGTIDLIREEYWLRLQRLEPKGTEQAILSGLPARRIFGVMRDRCRPFLVDEAVTLELSQEQDDVETPRTLEVGPEGPKLTDLLDALAKLAPSEWTIRYLQRGGTIDFCQKLMVAQTDRLHVCIGENFIPAVDAATEAAQEIPHFELALTNSDGTRIPHSLTQQEIEELSKRSNKQIAKSFKH